MSNKFKRGKEEEKFDPHKPVEVAPNKLPPVFSFHHLSKDYCITKCDNNDRLAFVEKMHKLSQITWEVIRTSHRHGLGSEKIDHKSIRASIPPHVTKEIPIIALRFNGKKPMVGYKEKNIFHVIWFDRDFTLYDHG